MTVRARRLREPGHEASNAAIADFARRQGCVIVTKDEDFVARIQNSEKLIEVV